MALGYVPDVGLLMTGFAALGLMIATCLRNAAEDQDTGLAVPAQERSTKAANRRATVGERRRT